MKIVMERQFRQHIGDFQYAIKNGMQHWASEAKAQAWDNICCMFLMEMITQKEYNSVCEMFNLSIFDYYSINNYEIGRTDFLDVTWE